MPQPLFGRGLNALQLKLIAFAAMVLDHLAAGLPFFWRPEMQTVYRLMRGIGRLAFPIFCYFIAVGAVKTKNRWQYLLRLGILALLCEAPFDLMGWGRFPVWACQNTIMTLFLGLLAITLFEAALKRFPQGAGALLAPAALLLCLGAAHFLKVDYGVPGVLLTLGFYFWQTALADLPYTPFLLMIMMAALWIHNPSQLISLLAFFLIFLYNGSLGKACPRYLFYAGYLGQLIVIAGIRLLL